MHLKQEISSFIINSMDNIVNDNPTVNLVICGDFNDLCYKDIETQHGIRNVIDFPTRGNATLDIVLLDNYLRNVFTTITSYPPLKNSDHNAILLKPKIEDAENTKRTILKKIKYKDLRNSNVNLFLESLSSPGLWDELYENTLDINGKCETFYKILNNALDLIPCTEVCIDNKDKSWMTPLVKTLIQKKWEAFNLNNTALYTHYKIRCQNEIRRAKQTWANNLINSKKKIWNLVSTLRTKDNLPIPHSHDINSALSRVFTATETKPNFHVDDPIFCKLIDPTEVEILLKNLKKKATGSDGISTRILKCAADIIRLPLTHIYNCSIISNQIPEIWKISKVIPIPKQKNPTLEQYRPISIIPIVAKLFEKILYGRLQRNLLDNYDSQQFGFRPGSSTTAANIMIQSTICKQLEDPETKAVSLIAFDASKAFDKVQHHKLVQMLLNTNLPRGFVRWLNNYLENRQQYVYCNNAQSDRITVTSGVIQGGIFSPALFCIYTAPLKCVHTKNYIYKYADDLTLCIAHTTAANDELLCKDETL